MSLYSDLELDKDTNDLNVIDRDLVVIPDTTEAIVQRLRIKLKFFKGEWFLNKQFGIPYNQTIFSKGTTKPQVDSIFRNKILSTPGVVELVTFSSELDAARRSYTLSFSCRASTGSTIILEV